MPWLLTICCLPRNSPRLLPLRLEHGAGSRRGEELDQRLCRRRVLRAHADAGMEDGVVLQFGWQRPQDFDAGRGHQFVDEDDAELDFSRGDELADFDARGGGDDFRSHLFGDADALEKAREVDAALAFFRPGDGVRGEERALERPRRADVGTRRAFPDADAHARAGDGGARARIHLALLREIVDPGGGEYGEVEGFARLDLALQGGGEAEADDELVSGRALEGGRELVQRLLHAVGGEDLDFGGVDRNRAHESGKPDGCGDEHFEAHDSLPVRVDVPEEIPRFARDDGERLCRASYSCAPDLVSQVNPTPALTAPFPCLTRDFRLMALRLCVRDDSSASCASD